jgi:hypothetical protein
MGFGVRTAKPPDSGESTAADHRGGMEFAQTETSLLAVDGGRSSLTQDGRLRERRNGGAWTVPSLVSEQRPA